MTLLKTANVPLNERWIILATRHGQWLQLFPRYFPNYFGSQHEAEDMVRLRLGMDPTFKARFLGWTFAPVPMHGMVIHGEDGSILSPGDSLKAERVAKAV